jgi:hypothetical protein
MNNESKVQNPIINRILCAQHDKILVWGGGGVTWNSTFKVKILLATLDDYILQPLSLIGVALVTFVRHLHKAGLRPHAIATPNLNPGLQITPTESCTSVNIESGITQTYKIV